MTPASLHPALATFFKRRWINPGNCLNHIKTALDLPDEHRPLIEVCMGLCSIGLHCWIEADGLVLDLTRPGGERFHDRPEFYSSSKMDESSIRRYSVPDMAKAMLREGITFWGFETAA